MEWKPTISDHNPKTARSPVARFPKTTIEPKYKTITILIKLTAFDKYESRPSVEPAASRIVGQRVDKYGDHFRIRKTAVDSVRHHPAAIALSNEILFTVPDVDSPQVACFWPTGRHPEKDKSRQPVPSFPCDHYTNPKPVSPRLRQDYSMLRVSARAISETIAARYITSLKTVISRYYRISQML